MHDQGKQISIHPVLRQQVSSGQSPKAQHPGLSALNATLPSALDDGSCSLLDRCFSCHSRTRSRTLGPFSAECPGRCTPRDCPEETLNSRARSIKTRFPWSCKQHDHSPCLKCSTPHLSSTVSSSEGRKLQTDFF